MITDYTAIAQTATQLNSKELSELVTWLCDMALWQQQQLEAAQAEASRLRAYVAYLESSR